MKVVQTENNKLIKIWADYVHIDEATMEQAKALADLPFIHKHIAIMPDAHLGKGACIGSVIVTKKAIVPAAVGVDLNCGMMAVKLNLTASQLPDNLADIRSAIEKAVPHGRTNNGTIGDKGAFKTDDLSQRAKAYWYHNIEPEYKKLLSIHPKAKAYNDVNHLGTLGTGNHFIELCIDESQEVWIMIHTGSRGFGNSLASYFIELAHKEMEKYHIKLAHKDLSYLVADTPAYDDYVLALNLAKKFAEENRSIIYHNTLNALQKFFNFKIGASHNFSTIVDCHHNYVTMENHFGENVLVTRKGAVSAKEGQLGIIPGSMGAKSFIVRGLGNKQSFCSCSHGAGRIMSRNEAKRTISLEEHSHDTHGVECRKDESVIDESPKAYKNIDDVMKSQDDLVEIVHTLKQVLCVKG